MITFQVRVTHNRFAEIAAALPERAGQVVAKTAHDIAGQAKVNTPPRVDTGAMMNGYRAEPIEGAGTYYRVYNTQHYHIYNELGTYKLAAHPMLVPAAEQFRPSFLAAMSQLEMLL